MTLKQTKLYVENLSLKTTADDLTQLFSKYGSVTRSQVVFNRTTGCSWGVGIVVMSKGANLALARLHGFQFQQNSLIISKASPGKVRPWSGISDPLRSADPHRKRVKSSRATYGDLRSSRESVDLQR